MSSLYLGAVSAQLSVSINGALGGSVDFNLTIAIPANRAITWRTDGGAVYIARILNNDAPTYNTSYASRTQLFRNGTLRLEKLTNADQKIYTVTVENQGDFSIQSVDYQLGVFPPLNAPVLLSNVTIYKPFTNGTNVTLQCDAGGQTVTSYIFYRDGQKIICSDRVICRGSFLDFTPVADNDGGSYTCTIQNPVSSNTSNSLSLTVYFIRSYVTYNILFHRLRVCPGNVSYDGHTGAGLVTVTEQSCGSHEDRFIFMEVPVSNVAVTSDVSGLIWPGLDSLTLKCSAHGTDISYSWSLKGALISGGGRYILTDNKSTLLISPVSTTDSGPFTCTAKNLVNSLTSNTVTQTLAAPVSAVALTSNTSAVLWAGQDSASLYCSAQGSAITFSWRLNGNQVSSKPPYSITQGDSPPNSTLTISPVAKNDTGPFTCTASNRANSMNSNGANLNINWFPDGGIVCTVQPINQVVKLGCSWPGGKPAANVTMIFGGTQNMNTSEVYRNVNSSSNIHGSNLTCNGDQLGRSSICTVIFEPPKFPDHKNDTITPAFIGGVVNLTVNLQSGARSRATTMSTQALPSTFSWYQANTSTPIQTGGKFRVVSTPYASTLNIDKLTEAESGEYKCVAENFMGSSTFLFNVKVSQTGGSSSGLDGGAIAGIVIGVLAGVALIGVIAFFIVKKRM
ncbi:cell adhesion molecule CEACAM1-like [Anomaloglossus baeobatrachus]